MRLTVKQARKLKLPVAMGQQHRLPGSQNKTEASYQSLLELRLKAGEIVWYKFEACKLRLANNTFYTPDFMVMLSTGAIEMHEVKGFWRDDARVKFKVAAATYPFRFVSVTRDKGGGWRERRIENE